MTIVYFILGISAFIFSFIATDDLNPIIPGKEEPTQGKG